jgi:signal transduction histidine kinase
VYRAASISRWLAHRALTLAALLLFPAVRVAAQQPSGKQPVSSRSEVIGQRLIPIPHGYLGVARQGEVLQITRYDAQLRDTAQTQYLHGSYPYDFRIPPVATGLAYLLAGFNGRAGLYAVALAGAPTLTPLWQSRISPMREIIGIDDYDHDGRQEAALLGDSAFALVGLDGGQRYVLRGDLIAGFVVPGDSVRFLLVSREGGNLLVDWVDAPSGRIAAQRSIEGTAEVLATVADVGIGQELLVSSMTPPFRLFRFDVRRMLLLGSRLLPGAPAAFVPATDGDIPTIAALFRSYPAPQLLPLVTAARPRSFDYPLGTVFDEAVTSPHLTALFARDSIAVYDHAMRLLGVHPAVGGNAPRLTEIDSTTLLVTTTEGSRFITIDRDGMSWLERNWMALALYICSGLLVIVLLMAARRYRFVRTLYNNLVRVPGSHGVIVISPSQRVIHINRSAREILEIAPYIPLGRHVSEYLVSEGTRLVMSFLRRLFADGEAFEIRVDLNNGIDSRALNFRGRQMFGQYGFAAGYLLLIEDVTQTIERERLVNWATVAHHIAHEMKTPLGTVKVTAEMLHDRLGSAGIEPDMLRATGRILKQSQRLREIVDDLLTVARTETLHKAGADVSLLVTSTAHECRESYPPSIDLTVQIHGEDFRCNVDVSQLTIAVRNLLDNAWQAIGDRAGGGIDVTVTDRQEAGVTVMVADNGVGMSRETMAKLFQPFYTEREGGSGIGTVIVKRVVEAHGGTVLVESELGIGTRFILNLPR